LKLLANSIWLATAPVDMRTGIDGLSLHVQQALGRAPCDGTAYVFANNRRSTRLKLVCWGHAYRAGANHGDWKCIDVAHKASFVVRRITN
jgi:transposase